MSELEKLYLIWNENESTDGAEIMETWEKIEELMRDTVPEQAQDDLESLIMRYGACYEEQGFLGGFIKATAIWRECA